MRKIARAQESDVLQGTAEMKVGLIYFSIISDASMHFNQRRERQAAGAIAFHAVKTDQRAGG